MLTKFVLTTLVMGWTGLLVFTIALTGNSLKTAAAGYGLMLGSAMAGIAALAIDFWFF